MAQSEKIIYHLSDDQLLKLTKLLLEDKTCYQRLKQLKPPKDFFQYNSKDFKHLFWAVIFNRSDVILEFQPLLNTVVPPADKDAFLKLCIKKILMWKWKFQTLPEVLKSSDPYRLERILTDYLRHFSYSNGHREISYDNNLSEALKEFSALGSCSSGFPTLDKILGGGFFEKRTYLFAGGSGQGKSTILRNIAVNIAKSKKRVLYLTLEMGAVEAAALINKLVSSDEIWKNIIIIEDENYDANSIPLLLDRIKPDALVIDYIDEYSPIDWKEMGSIIKQLRDYSKTFRLPLISAVQLARQGYNELIINDAVYLSALAGSFEKVKKSEFVGLLQINKNIMSVKVLKNRWGPSGGTLKFSLDLNSLSLQEVSG